MFLLPMAFMLIVTLTSLVFTFKSNITAFAGGNGDVFSVIRAVLCLLLFILAIVLAVEGVQTISKYNKKNAKA